MRPDGEELVAGDKVVGLRRFTLDDVDAITEACQDVEIARWTTIPSPYTADYASAFVALTSEWHASGVAHHFAIVERRGGGLSGAIGLDSARGPRGSVGYWVAPWARRRGVATRALRLVTAWAFENLSIDAIGLVTGVGNVASERVAVSAGYEPCDHVMEDGPADAVEPVAVREWVRRRADPLLDGRRG